MKTKSFRNDSGFSIVELLIVLTLFSILAVLTTQSLFYTLQGTRKSEAILNVRENVDYSLAIIERQLRNAISVDPCPIPNPYRRVDYISADGASAYFECQNIGGADSQIASYSGAVKYRLTTDSVSIISCSFTCTSGGSASPPSVSINLVAEDRSAQGIEGAQITASTRILLRSY